MKQPLGSNAMGDSSNVSGQRDQINTQRRVKMSYSAKETVLASSYTIQRSLFPRMAALETRAIDELIKVEIPHTYVEN